MKALNHITLSVLLGIFSSHALAGWVEIEQFEDGMRVYVDHSSGRRTGDEARVEHLVRWAEPQLEDGQPAYLSTKVRTDYDCAGKREKYVSSISYAGTMGNGARIAIDDSTAENWSSISPSTMEEKLWRVACNAH